ncbi:ABC transporter substrate-binding protein [Nocardioides bruguierae]|uniref:ABC transporter substrate-binding protein n=1 Tax=Nocardioides bruguierae TaxID=2945102 RepID=UPI00201FE64F|nr:extracellular solute-binding protein [Nocardioides bruguierae]MCL8025494.1 extracellular solute-binding protein [Nocardioides bruguierae]
MSALRLLGRDFDGFRRAVDAHAADSPAGAVTARWLGLPELQAAVLGPAAPEADLLVVPADWLPALAAAGRVRPLTPWLETAPPEGWPTAWSPSFHAGVTWGTDVVGVPFHDGPQLTFTRTDLAQPPATWGELLATAARLHGAGTAGTVLAGAPDGHNNVYDLVLHLWRHGGDLVDEDGGVLLDSAATRATLRFLREVATTLVPADAHDLDSNGSGTAFGEGRVGVAVNWAGYAALAGDVPFSVGLAPTADDGTPTTTVNAFWATAVTTTCTDPDRAWAHVRHAASAEMDLATTRAGASGARRSTWSHPDVLATRPEHALFEAAHATSRPLPRLAALPQVVDVLSDLVDAVVWRGEPVEPALAAAHTAVAALVAGHRPADAPATTVAGGAR